MVKKIGWQKYEDMLQNQLNSPFGALIATNQLIMSMENEDDENSQVDFMSAIENEEREILVIPVPESINQQIALMSNYDCWIGHANFNITDDVRMKLKTAPGVEISKVYGRYRFFLGIGKMFDFADVRKGIEELLL